jgi:hypothetical protein
MNLNTRRRVCELVAGIIASDRELHPAELKFMLKTFSTFGIATGKDDEAVCPTVTTFEAAKAMRALPEEVRHEAIDLLIRSAVTDGKVTPDEREWLLAVGRAADVPETTIEERLTEQLMNENQRA